MNSIVDFKEISELNLDQIKQKLVHVESGEGWTQEQANATEVEYRRFLYLMKKFPNEPTSPAVAVDTFWHYHILDTMKYAADCEQVFGHFLHHNPYVGMHGEDAGAEHHSSGERMRELYEQTFAVSYNPGAAFCGVVHPPVQEAGKAQAAFCGIVHPPGQDKAAAGTAFCGIVRPPKQQAAFCGIVRPPEQQAKAAFCGIVRPPEQQAKAAFCGIVRPPEQQATAAFCGIVRPPEQQASGAKAAFCSNPNKQAATAYCALGKLPHAKGDAMRTNAGVETAAAH